MVNEAGTLLVVDDEVEIREIMELYASALGFNVLEACDGEQALEVFESHHIDVVVSDLTMPRLSGLGLLEALRHKGLGLPFVFVTGYPTRDSTAQALRLGAFDYLEKPFDRDELQKILSEAMRFSLEQQKIMPLSVFAGTPGDAAASQETEREILRLRHLRAAREGKTSTAAPNTAGGDGSDSHDSHESNQMLELFLNETLTQLIFCDGAIQGLAEPDLRAYELGYLFRVMQAVAKAANALGANEIEALASAAERIYTVLRVKPRTVDEPMRNLVARANKLLTVLVQGLADPTLAVGDFQDTVTALEAAAARLEGRVIARAAS